MIVFEVLLNGKSLVSAGRNDLSVLNLIVTADGILGPESLGTKVKKDGFELTLHVGGATSENLARWVQDKKIAVGDEVILKIRKSSTADPDVPPKYTEEQIEKMKKHKETADLRKYEEAKKTYFELRDKYEKNNG